jgi:photosystem II stability/assembly factor-like uncharacterized protein
MKKYIFRLILVSFILSQNNVFSQIGWTWQNPYPQGNHLQRIKFWDANTGIAIGYEGAILITNNSGENWQFNLAGTYNRFTGLTVLPNGIAVVSGMNGTLAKTTNYGNNWVTFSTSSEWYTNNAFININTGFYANYKYIMKTTNGGYNWAQVGYFDGIDYFDMIFKNDNTGFICGWDGSLIKTSNGGNLWLRHYIAPYYNRSIHFPDQNNGFISGDDGFFARTSNGGVSWDTGSTRTTYNQYGIFFADSNNGFVTTNDNKILKTTNRGINWQTVTLPCEYNSMYSLCFTDVNTGFTAGLFGSIYKTTNAGINWISKSGCINQLNAIDFVNNSTGFAAGNYGTFLKTTNGGINWSRKTTNVSQTLTSFKFKNANQGYLISNNGTILKTSNGGENWNSAYNNSNEIYNSICLLNNSDSLIIGGSSNSNGSIFFKVFTNDKKEINDFICIIPGCSSVNSVKFINMNTGFAAGANGIIAKTINKGINWTVSNPGINETYTCLEFINQTTGFAVTNGGKVIETTNCGLTWYNVYVATQGLFSVKFFNLQTGYISGYNGFFARTTDCGDNWSPNFTGTYNTLYSISITDSVVLYLAGQGGAILKSINGGISSSIKKISESVIKSFSLSQNYPNPFNPSTNIRYKIPKNSFVILKVYNILGKEIATLVNEKLSPGEYESTFDGGNLPSGVYFYSLYADGVRIDTKKMVLLK